MTDRKPEATQQQDWSEAAIGLGLRMGKAPHTIVEIHDDKLCVWQTDKEPQRYDLAQAKKILPKLIDFIIKER